MLRGIAPIINPDLLSVLYRMGHGDEIILADAHFPVETFGQRVVRCDGISINQILDGLMPLFTLDQYDDEKVMMMEVVPGDTGDPSVEAGYREIIEKHETDFEVKRIERFAFYERAKQAFCIVTTGDTKKYGNLILKKGVIQ
ncbi:MAG: L-fucose mutarotase [Lentisphaeria bacterium]|nr:L-fucose mutarotase [Lentisphaeria bacterium]